MNLLYTITTYPPSIGGAQLYTHQLAKTLSANHAVQVVSFWDTNRTDWLLCNTLKTAGHSHDYRIHPESEDARHLGELPAEMVQMVEQFFSRSDLTPEQLALKSMRLNASSDLPHYNLGVIYGDQGEYDRAISEFNLAISLNPKRAHSHYYLGAAYETLGKKEEALKEYKKSLELNPNQQWVKEKIQELSQ